MLSYARSSLAPAYLFACLIFGGSAQGIWQNMVLEIAGVIIIAWAALDKGKDPLSPEATQLLLLAILAIATVGLQMIPLPPAIWSHLGPRHAIAADFQALDLRVPAEPLSLTPHSGFSSLLGIIPALAIFCAMVRLKAYRPSWLAIALIAGTLTGIALGALQVASSTTELSPWYLYEETNPGRGVGFFANANHMACLLVVAIPFLAAMAVAGKTANLQRYYAIVAASGGVGILLLVGLALNGSLAGYGLGLPVIAASALLILPPTSRLRPWVLALTALLLIASVIAIETTPIGAGRIGEHATVSVQSRTEILATTSRAIRDFMPFGSGLGSFSSVYLLYERPEGVTSTYVNHAHNDYAEIILELGFPGIVLILLFFVWWIVAVLRVWRLSKPGPFARAAVIASAAVLVHSVVDFPLRTAAIITVFGMCLALLADNDPTPPRQKGDLRRSRHVVIK